MGVTKPIPVTTTRVPLLVLIVQRLSRRRTDHTYAVAEKSALAFYIMSKAFLGLLGSRQTPASLQAAGSTVRLAIVAQQNTGSSGSPVIGMRFDHVSVQITYVLTVAAPGSRGP